MSPQELEQVFRSIVKNESRLRIWLDTGAYYLYAWYNSWSLYLHPLAEAKVPKYDIFQWHSQRLYELLGKIERIENYEGDELKPVYTKFDGLISKDCPLIKVGQRYYTQSYLEYLINKE